MSQQVIIDYQQIAIQCNSICDIAEARRDFAKENLFTYAEIFK